MFACIVTISYVFLFVCTFIYVVVDGKKVMRTEGLRLYDWTQNFLRKDLTENYYLNFSTSDLRNSAVDNFSFFLRK